MLKALMRKSKEIVALYTNAERSNKFTVGLVQCISDDFMLIASISPAGLYDGYVVMQHDAVYRSDTQTKYLRKIEKLYGIQNQKHQNITPESDDLISEILRHAHYNKLVVLIEIEDSERDDIQGFVIDVQREIVIIHQLDDYGESDGESVVILQNITRISCDGEKEIALKLLAQNRNSDHSIFQSS